jgi:hypothetical protein
MTTKKKPQIAGLKEFDSAYDAFVEGLDLIGLALKSCRCDLDRGAFFSIDEPVKAFVHKYRLTELSGNSFDAEGYFELSISEAKDKAPAVKMECIYETHFHGEAPILRENAERFIESELKLVLLPHARQFFYSLGGQMSIQPIVVPLSTKSGGSKKKALTKG